MNDLVHDGFIGWPDAVPQDRIDRALNAIHRSLGAHGLHPDRLFEYDQSTYCPELRNHPDLLALFDGTPLSEHAERLLGPLAPAAYAQIALRFPNESPAREPHLDGVAAPHNGVETGTIDTFSALACIYLSDVRADGGALTVWPGSHLQHAEYFAEHGPESLLRGMPDVPKAEPVPLVGRAGHAYLVHYLCAHAVGIHRAPGIRYAVFFRLRAHGHRDRGRATMVDPWLEWRLGGADVPA